MTHEEKRLFLISNGWHSYYSEKYWVHPKTVVDALRQDYTEYGLGLDEAYAYETNPDSKPWDGQLLHGTMRW